MGRRGLAICLLFSVKECACKTLEVVLGANDFISERFEVYAAFKMVWSWLSKLEILLSEMGVGGSFKFIQPCLAPKLAHFSYQIQGQKYISVLFTTS